LAPAQGRQFSRRPSDWPRTAARALASGSAASIASTAALSIACRLLGKPAVSGTNATSHWLWGRSAWHARRGDLRHTVAGYLIHHASSVWWAGFFEYRLARRGRAPAAATIAADAVAVSALAAAVDYLVVPKRLTPGFEAHLRAVPIALVYLAFAGGLAASALLRRRA
jgi:hypothetical protein